MKPDLEVIGRELRGAVKPTAKARRTMEAVLELIRQLDSGKSDDRHDVELDLTDVAQAALFRLRLLPPDERLTYAMKFIETIADSGDFDRALEVAEVAA